MTPFPVAVDAGAPAVDPLAQDLFERFLKDGPHPEIHEFQRQLGGGRGASDVYAFIRDAVTGKGGFASGDYLFPYRLERQQDAHRRSPKLPERRAQADYDRFAGHICMAAWDLISAHRDLVKRTTEDEILAQFWEDCDGRGTHIQDLMEYAHRQARMYRTAFIFMDRPVADLRDQAADRDPRNRPVVWVVPSRHVVHWALDHLGGVEAIAVAEPRAGETLDRCRLRIWTREAVSVYTPPDGGTARADEWEVSTVPNTLGMVPVARLWNDKPDTPAQMLGESEMLDVAKLAQTVYNIDSEKREIERKCALFLAMPVKDAKQFDQGQLVVGTESVLLYDGEAGEPRWISPDLAILDKLATERQDKIDAAYSAASLRALVGNIQTTSGFHAEVEFSKSERRVARHAAAAEDCETQLALMFLRFYGLEDEQAAKSLFRVEYPKQFGVRDLERVIERTTKMLAMGLGDEADRRILEGMFQAVFPRLPDADISALVDDAIKTKATAASAGERIRKLISSGAAARVAVDPEAITAAAAGAN
jgi:hypothetical protein